MQLQGLESAALVAAPKYKASCAAQPSTPEPPNCARLHSCLTQLQASGTDCRGALARAQTNQDAAYATQARGCVSSARTARVACSATNPAAAEPSKNAVR